MIPELLERASLRDIPWIAWLDFDQAMDEERLQQLDDLVRYLPGNSTLITTFSATRAKYGKPTQRLETLKGLFGFAVPNDIKPEDLAEEDDLARVLTRTLRNRMVSLALEAGRPAAVPAFELRYKDGTPMATVGVFLPSTDSADSIRDLTSSSA